MTWAHFKKLYMEFFSFVPNGIIPNALQSAVLPWRNRKRGNEFTYSMAAVNSSNVGGRYRIGSSPENIQNTGHCWGRSTRARSRSRPLRKMTVVRMWRCGLTGTLWTDDTVGAGVEEVEWEGVDDGACAVAGREGRRRNAAIRLVVQDGYGTGASLPRRRACRARWMRIVHMMAMATVVVGVATSTHIGAAIAWTAWAATTIAGIVIITAVEEIILESGNYRGFLRLRIRSWARSGGAHW